ncbi:MAG TPA: alpha-amylase/4-alpha-glucanotransferase domain-containing protein [Methylomirabilota bacterium]|nr:alpha-amylase/4-alpha-glucanotransferase domain-containing protein [Methylomirabilota bacterium]
MSEALSFLFGVHNHQPAGNFESVVGDAVSRAYRPFLEVLRDIPDLPVTVHCSGTLLVFLRDKARSTFDLLGSLVSAGRVELLTGGFYEPILAMLPDRDKIGQIQALTEFLKSSFGVSPRGMWLAERVWEPQLPRALREAGVEFVLVDDSHFAQAGLDPETLGGYYVTEEQGATLAVFPISQRLRYLVPFAEPAEAVRYLERCRDRGAVTLMDDGEKFGIWPGTDRLVYGEGWLARFLQALRDTPWLRVSTFSQYVDANPPRGRIYLPTTSYTEMGEWALPAEASAELVAARHRLEHLADGDRVARLLRGGFWRNFLVKYPEVADAYWKMLRLSARVQDALAARPGDPRLLEARERLWQGQANDAYWHGVFGGCYLPHLRRAVKSALVACERLLGPADERAGIDWCEADVDGDGQVEVVVRTGDWSVLVRPARGGTLTELALVSRDLDAGDVLTRRREAYHHQVKDPDARDDGDRPRTIHAGATAREPGLSTLLDYDRFRRASLLDGLFAAGGPLDALSPWDAARAMVGERAMRHTIRVLAGAVEVTCSLDTIGSLPLAVDKSVTVPREGAALDIRYRLRWTGAEPLRARWAVQFNLALSAGDAPGRYFDLEGRPSLGSRGRCQGRRGLAMVDEWLGCALVLDWAAPAEVTWAPVETVSLSESGFERIYQGSAVLITWPLDLAAGASWEMALRLGVCEAVQDVKS